MRAIASPVVTSVVGDRDGGDIAGYLSGEGSLPRRDEGIVGRLEMLGVVQIDVAAPGQLSSSALRPVPRHTIGHASCRHFNCIPGVGPLLATALVASVADPKTFRSGRNFSASIGWFLNSTRAAVEIGSAVSASMWDCQQHSPDRREAALKALLL